LLYIGINLFTRLLVYSLTLSKLRWTHTHMFLEVFTHKALIGEV